MESIISVDIFIHTQMYIEIDHASIGDKLKLALQSAPPNVLSWC